MRVVRVCGGRGRRVPAVDDGCWVAHAAAPAAVGGRGGGRPLLPLLLQLLGGLQLEGYDGGLSLRGGGAAPMSEL